ncbi:hypothetical protein SPRG_01754 [Saprolegnia parasitica CBS 223.65]|uniref:Uncharacterized protein n=1 Tax=Saprolegnia parasitica (strain CBS 223.65) TaxID=695850 RepID=A0A067CT40_SAPPC|nr:hypothetical protein SPRG_01754 [Saprolegnia parasitica CBS 223.65]KDO33874.1 hypothetical protein SPRG_01754 [Saprolegnia parasitica CBS 223.65]|eukprot:XP_012195510.1 hypothetical protein SPRG_01754 [Saprolegnia parasitica CBS 223.65]
MRVVGDFEVVVATTPGVDDATPNVKLRLRYVGAPRLTCESARYVKAWVYGVEMEGVALYSEATREVTQWVPQRQRSTPATDLDRTSIVLQVRRARVERVAMAVPLQKPREANRSAICADDRCAPSLLSPIVVKASSATTYRLSRGATSPSQRPLKRTKLKHTPAYSTTISSSSAK